MGDNRPIVIVCKPRNGGRRASSCCPFSSYCTFGRFLILSFQLKYRLGCFKTGLCMSVCVCICVCERKRESRRRGSKTVFYTGERNCRKHRSFPLMRMLHRKSESNLFHLPLSFPQHSIVIPLFP